MKIIDWQKYHETKSLNDVREEMEKECPEALGALTLAMTLNTVNQEVIIGFFAGLYKESSMDRDSDFTRALEYIDTITKLAELLHNSLTEEEIANTTIRIFPLSEKLRDGVVDMMSQMKK
jgi:hypothetical protein